MSGASGVKDLYKILQVSRTATTMEIKASYRKLALALHPDRHDGCVEKTKAFKEASEAYNILIDNSRRREYDLATGWTPHGWYNKNRRRAPPPNYRKVYAPHPPPNGKWHDAQRHYDMHYGEGQFREAIRNAYERAQENGDFDYNSPLGKGFVFETMEDRKSSSRRYGGGGYKNNPFSKAEQGPPGQEYKYEEGYTNFGEAKQVLKRKQTVVDKLHERRQDRQRDRQQAEEASTSKPIIPGQRTYKPLNGSNGGGGGGGCTIM